MAKVKIYKDLKKILKNWHMAVPVEYLIDTTDGDVSVSCVGDRGKPDAYLYVLPSDIILEGSGIVGRSGRSNIVLIREGERMFAFLGRDTVLSLEWGGYYRFDNYFDFEGYIQSNFSQIFVPELLTR